MPDAAPGSARVDDRFHISCRAVAIPKGQGSLHRLVAHFLVVFRVLRRLRMEEIEDLPAQCVR